MSNKINPLGTTAAACNIIIHPCIAYKIADPPAKFAKKSSSTFLANYQLLKSDPVQSVL
jgi:hypothetical protein